MQDLFQCPHIFFEHFNVAVEYLPLFFGDFFDEQSTSFLCETRVSVWKFELFLIWISTYKTNMEHEHNSDAQSPFNILSLHVRFGPQIFCEHSEPLNIVDDHPRKVVYMRLLTLY